MTASSAAAPPRRRYATRVPAADRREQVLDAALRIIVSDGYGAVSIEAIARDLDVTRPVIYSHFDGLGALLHALLDRQEQRALRRLLDALGTEPDLAELRGYVHATVASLCAMVAGDPNTWAPILAPPAATPEPVRARIRGARETVRARLQALVEAAIDTGAVPTRVDARVLSHALVAMGEHFGQLLIEDPTALDADAIASTIDALLVR